MLIILSLLQFYPNCLVLLKVAYFVGFLLLRFFVLLNLRSIITRAS